jgi:hypothetical protein
MQIRQHRQPRPTGWPAAGQRHAGRQPWLCNFTPLDQAALHGRTGTVRLLIERGADLHDCAFDEDGPTPLDCAPRHPHGQTLTALPAHCRTGTAASRKIRRYIGPKPASIQMLSNAR